MSKLEQIAQRKRKRLMIEKTIIAALGAAAIIGIAMAAPNAVQLLKYVDLGAIGNRDPRRRVSEAMSRLRRKGLVEWRETKGAWRLRLTEKGRVHFAHVRLAAMRVPQPRRWDGRWRFVMFDIPESRSALRQSIRALITGFGFHRFQNSVWVYPYDCEDFVTLLKLELGVGNQLLYVVADAVEYDAPLRKYFGLQLDRD